MNTIDKQEQIWQSLSNHEYRQQFVEEEINVGLALQIKAIRDKQELTQTELAKKMGVRQPLISQWEDPDYEGKFTLSSLKDLAKVFDVALLVKFVPFSKLVEWTTNITKDSIAPPKYKEDNLFPISAADTVINNRLKEIEQNIDTSNSNFDYLSSRQIKDKELCLHA